MATTPEQAQLELDEFSQGYADEQQAPAQMTEDEAFGLGPVEQAENPAAEAAEPAQEDPAMEAAEPPEAPEVEGAESGGEGAMEDTASEAPIAEDAKDHQREKSWEGRLKVWEADLREREAALNTNREPAAEMAAEGETPAQDAAEAPTAETLEEVVSQVESGEMTAEAAMATLSNDFGPDFAKMIDVLISAKASEVAGKTADEKVASVSKNLDGLIGELVDDKAKTHFESISDTHPDYMEIGNSPEFKAYVDGLPASEQETAVKIIGSGSARQINKLLTDYKKGQQPAEQPDETAMDAAEGVRGKALKIPDAPKQSQGYEDAWEQF